jgi:uncharacterized integral membrane protein
MVFTKKVTKAPAVMVETKKLSAKDTCDMGCCDKIKHFLVAALLIINTLLLVWILYNQMNVEAQKVGGRWNYQMVQQIYKSDAFQAQQKQQIEQALQMYKDGWAQQAATLPVNVQPEVQPVVTE